jgi:hypothetical protein
MKSEEQNRIDEYVLGILRRENRELTASELVNIVTSKSRLSDIDVKRALWRLIYYQLAYMSPEQFVRAVPEGDDLVCELVGQETNTREKVA